MSTEYDARILVAKAVRTGGCPRRRGGGGADRHPWRWRWTVGGIYRDLREVQNAADSAALAGAELLMTVPPSYPGIPITRQSGTSSKIFRGTYHRGDRLQRKPARTRRTIRPHGAGNGMRTINLGAGVLRPAFRDQLVHLHGGCLAHPPMWRWRRSMGSSRRSPCRARPWRIERESALRGRGLARQAGVCAVARSEHHGIERVSWRCRGGGAPGARWRRFFGTRTLDPGQRHPGDHL